MDQIIELTVAASDSGMRIDAYLRANTELSRSRLSALIQEGAIIVNGTAENKPSFKVETGQTIRLSVPEARPVDIVPQNIPIDILYQDSDVVMVNKPCGMVVHPAAGNEDRTLVNALLYHIKDLSGIGGEMRPGIVHRLDKDTSGLILVAKNDHAHTLLSEQFKERSMEKHYRAVAFGNFSDDHGLIDAPIARHPVDRKKMAIVPAGKPSQTEWSVLERLKSATYLDVHLLTGRTHQIRVHMHSIGHPLLGDRIYAPNIKTSVHIPRLMLHAYSLSFTHPTTGERMTVSAPLPEKFSQTLDKLK
ncbi:MAG: RluA family pseudouridine synthase [Clostridia bacterium]|nr:RluA family pseudouridine synthase [Clostridia bacterium]MBQ6859404.1 RluA family pseudouridine synthase [Clostridia bacterium]MBQ7051460.1 RluA family pseudouridine synthase [Clostridia bacterium]